ncbi:MAG: hypothetical protein QNJ22_15315 [Desulfosarcinaceae bacterium]|nr:hypothetical protein [Desulfosarcinaceae bacterium]
MIYLGNFLFLTNQEAADPNERRHGSFNLVVNAEDEATAVAFFKTRIEQYREESSFFEGICEIFFMHLMEFDRFPENQAVMLNYRSQAGDPVLPYIECAAPLSDNNACKIHEWDQNQPATEGKPEKLFMRFAHNA